MSLGREKPRRPGRGRSGVEEVGPGEQDVVVAGTEAQDPKLFQSSNPMSTVSQISPL
jgi:hypothetical protein